VTAQALIASCSVKQTGLRPELPRGRLALPQSQHSGNTTEDLVSWAMAALELYRATGEEAWGQEARHLGNQLRELQVRSFRGASGKCADIS